MGLPLQGARRVLSHSPGALEGETQGQTSESPGQRVLHLGRSTTQFMHFQSDAGAPYSHHHSPQSCSTTSS